MELFANDTQTVEANDAVVYSTALSSGSQSILWRAGSSIVTLRGIGPQLRSRFRVSYHANVALPQGATVAPITLAILINGEAIASSKTISTPTAVEAYNNVAATTFIDVASGCCTQISLGNLSDAEIDIQDCSLIVERVA